MQRKRASPEVARHYHALCQAAGLKEVSQQGFFVAGAADGGMFIRYMHDVVAEIRPALGQYGIASEGEVDGVLQQLQKAVIWKFQVYFAAMHVELIAQVP